MRFSCGFPRDNPSKLARQVNLSLKTVDARKCNLMPKVGLHDRTELIRYAIGKRLLEI